MSDDYIQNVRKYRPDASEDKVASIIKHLGITLESHDASLVACTEESELDRIRESWCKRKLGSELSDDALDAVINEVCTEMAPEKSNKSRVTFYYIVADKLDKLVTL